MVGPEEPTAFTLDRFQREAIAALDGGRSVLVCAPTGSGKTVVAEHGVAAALARGRRAFYTTPIKALSNQKHRDLAAVHGADRVGLVTGDVSIGAASPIVVMTTEVLRNMLYAGSDALDGLRLRRPRRGPLPGGPRARRRLGGGAHPHSTRRALRVPVGDGLERRRARRLAHVGAGAHRRGRRAPAARRAPEPLSRRGAVGAGSKRCRCSSTGSPIPSVTASASTDRRGGGRRARRGRGSAGGFPGAPRSQRSSRRRTACRPSCSCSLGPVVTRRPRGSPSRVCASRLRRSRRRSVPWSRPRAWASANAIREVLQLDRFTAQLAAGIAAHHAGMVPALKVAVEECFSHGLVKLVFATETLALGLNMPARSVVIEHLTRFRGEGHEMLTPGEYTQLTGRAGRRGHRPGRRCNRAVVALRALRRSRRARREPRVPTPLRLSSHVQHGGQPRGRSPTGSGASNCCPARSPSSSGRAASRSPSARCAGYGDS